MRVFLVLATLVVAVQMAVIPWSDPSTSDKYAVHYNSHNANVAQARRTVSEQLSGIDNQYEASASHSDLQQRLGANGARLCTVQCGKGEEFAADENTELINQSHVGVGYVGFNEADAQSEYNHQRTSEHVSESGSVSAAAPATLVYTAPAAASTYSHNANHEHELSELHTSANPTVAIVAPVASVGSDSEHYQRHIEQSSSITSNNNSPAYAPIAAYPTAGISSGSNSRYSNNVHQQQRYAETRPLATVAPIEYVQPTINYGGGRSSSSRSSSDRYQQQHSLNPAPVQPIAYYPSANGGSESQTTRSERITERKTIAAAAPQPAFIYVVQPQPQLTSESFSAGHTSASDHYVNAAAVQPIYYPAVVPAVPSHRSTSARLSSSSAHLQNLQQQQYGQNTLPAITYGSRSEIDALNVNRHSNQQYALDRATHIGRIGQKPSSRYGSTRLTDGSHLQSTSLDGIMSESHRLARDQARSDYSSGLSHASQFDEHSNQLGVGGGFGGQQQGVALGGGGNGAYYRTKQWENNEKWSSDSQYDEQGRRRTHSTLSTGESELHNVNGRTAGYQAATSTVENDGKTSTYTLST